MQSSPAEKQMCSTNCKEKIFNVRKVPYKPGNNQNCKNFRNQDSKFKFSPFQEESYEPKTLQGKKKQTFNLHFTPNPQKDLRKMYQNLRDQYKNEKANRLQKLKQREEQLNNYTTENERLLKEKQKLEERRDTIKRRIIEIRQKNQILKQEQFQRNEQIRIMNMQYLRNMILEMRFQNGVDINPDQMTYQQLLELEEKIGKVSKGLSEEQFKRLNRFEAKSIQDVCPICYNNVKDGQQLISLPCKHYFHVDCIKQWLSNEKICPICKQEVFLQKSQSLESTQ